MERRGEVMERSFAGFWRDGAVVKPEEDHWKKRRIVACWKDSEWYEVLSDRFTNWHQVYWLDTTTPTELSPQEALKLLKVINPNCGRISRDGRWWALLEPGSHIINWGDLTEYPPKQHWRVPTDADKGKKCRVHNPDGELLDLPKAIFCGFHPSGACIVDTGAYGLLPYARCEVLD
jgi:hypothetical protein